MGQPAARVGDLAGHGGTISPPGVPTVLIGGQPAANLTSLYVCPAVNGTVPHVGGTFAKGSATVFIGGQPALRVGDAGNGPACPGATVLRPGCPTVLIGG